MTFCIQLLFKHRITFINSNFHLHKERISSNIRVRVLINVAIVQCATHFRYMDKNFSSIQLLVNKKYFHQSSFKFIKTFFISPASICATLFIKVRGKSGGWESPRLVCLANLNYYYLQGVTQICIQSLATYM